ncbi:MAG: methyltransferase domain-containing protein [Planctomycetes bacterium]|nr:methyltransferase domain-containing protein [Planctomycetota bacterium]
MHKEEGCQAVICEREAQSQDVSSPDEDRAVLSRYRRRFANPQSAAAYEERFQRRKAGTNRLEAWALRRALSRLGHLDRVLDVPAGTGRLFDVLSDYTREAAVASDVSVEMLDLARSQSEDTGDVVHLVQADLLALPFADDAFDAVVCVRFVHHLRSGRTRVEALGELARVSRRYVVMTFFDYLGVWGMRQGWKRLRGKKPNPSAVPLARFQAEAARAGLRFVRSVRVLPALSEERIVVLEKDPEASAVVEEAPERVSTRLRVGRRVSGLTWPWMGLLAALMLLCRWWEIEDAEPFTWTPGILLMLVGAALLVWSYQSRRKQPEHLAVGPYALMRHPALVGGALWLCGFALTCELWWMAALVWPAVLGGLWLAVEYAEAQRWLQHGHAYDLYVQQTPPFVPTAGALRSLWSEARRGVKAEGGRLVGPLARLRLAVWGRAALVTSAGLALALLKDISYS